MYVNIPHIYEPPKTHQDKQLEEFLRGEICCQNFINQDLTFLQPSVIHAPKLRKEKILPQDNTTEASPLETLEENPPQEQDSDS